MQGIDTVFHAATLHKPHVVTHSVQDFIDSNISGTANLLQAAVAQGVGRFVFTSTTSMFGAAMRPGPGQPAVWVTEDMQPLARNIYGVSKRAAEDLCLLVHRLHGLPCIVLRTSRFFPEEDDDRAVRKAFSADNTKANEFLYRRVEIEDVVSAHLLAAQRAPELGFDTFIISATSPFRREDLARLRHHAPAVLAQRVPQYEAVYRQLGWTMFPGIDRVYDNAAARSRLGWQPRYDFAFVLDRLSAGEDLRSEMARAIGVKGYHQEDFEDGPFPVH
jgi:nucleoside-diphosphate-sugar epimerase